MLYFEDSVGGEKRGRYVLLFIFIQEVLKIRNVVDVYGVLKKSLD